MPLATTDRPKRVALRARVASDHTAPGVEPSASIDPLVG
jgi:hypothetical protein